MERRFEIATVIGIPYPWVNGVLRRRPGELVRADDEILVVELAGLEVRTSVRITVGSLGEAGPPDPASHLPVRWEAEERPQGFPTFDGRLAAEPLSVTETLLTLEGGYQPPLGPVGYVADVLFMHRVARAALQGFFARAVDRLEEEYARDLSLRGEPLM